MFYEERIIDGQLMYRTTPKSEWMIKGEPESNISLKLRVTNEIKNYLHQKGYRTHKGSNYWMHTTPEGIKTRFSFRKDCVLVELKTKFAYGVERFIPQSKGNYLELSIKDGVICGIKALS